MKTHRWMKIMGMYLVVLGLLQPVSGSAQTLFTTNDLWLQFGGTTSAFTSNGTANLSINAPWNVTNGVYDLFSTTNLAPNGWLWVMRTAPGQTNLIMTGLSGRNEYFILGSTLPADDGSGLTVAYEHLVGIAIFTQPGNQLAILTSNATFSVTAAGIAPLSYQWYLNSAAVNNATNSTLALNNIQTNNEGAYFVVVRNSIGATTSSNAVLAVLLSPFSITNPPNDAVFIASLTNITLQTTASDMAGTISQVQFFQGTTSLGIATNPPYTLVWSNASLGSYGLSAVVVDNGLTATSQVVNISITSLFATNTLGLWLKADSISGLTNNAPVNTWYDSSGWSNNATQGSASQQPVYVANLVNGYPVVRFNGSNSFFSLPNFLAEATGMEAMVVLKAAVTPSGESHGLWYMGGSGTGNGSYTDHGIADDFGSTVLYTVGTPSQPLTEYHIYEVASQSNRWSAWINGLPCYDTFNNTVVFIGKYPTGPYTPFLGGTAGDSGNGGAGSSLLSYFNGDIAEVLVFNRTLTAGERTTVNNYLNGKYGLVPAVPATPSNLVAVAVSTGQISLTWNEMLDEGATRISIERKLGSGGTYAMVAQVTNGLSYVDTGLTAGTEYYYRVRAINVNTWSPYSNETNTTTLIAGSDIPFSRLQLWLKADSGLPQTRTNALVSFWTDQSGNNNTAVQTGSGNESRLVPGAFNGYPVVRFNGSNSFFSLPNFLAGATGMEAMVVLKVGVTPSGESHGLWYMGGSGTGSGSYTDHGIADDFGSTALYSVGTPSQPLTEYHIYEVASQTNRWSAWINGVPCYDTFNNTVVFIGKYPTGPYTPFLGGTAGNYGNGGAGGSLLSYFNGDIEEVLVFNRTLAAGERGAVRSYLNNKYVLVSVLPTAPEYLTATAASPTQINLAWVNTSLVLSGVQIERKTDVTGVYSVVAEIGAGVTNYSNNGLVSGHVYYYRIRASNLAGNSPYSSEAGASVDTLPTVSLTNPTNGALFISPAAIQLNAMATNGDAAIVSMEFFSNGTNSLGLVANAPYSLTWSNVLGGVYSLTAQATDILGAVSNSTPVSITVSNVPPAVRMTAPTNNAAFITPATITLTAAASDTNGTVSEVDFFYGSTTIIGTVANGTNGIYAFSWTNVAPGNYQLIAVAVDNEGGTATSSVVNITVSNTPPTINIVTPTNNAIFQAPAAIPLTVNANDANGTVVKVDYYYGATSLIGESTASPFGLVWSNVAAGTNSITAKATDNDGASTTSIAVKVIVNAQPTISITNPVNNATFSAGANITNQATAHDADDTISGVDFYYDNTNHLIGSKTSAPYSIVLTNAPFGTYTLVAVVRDNRGGVGISSPVTISVSTNLNDMADSYVRGGSFSNSNYGSATSLLVQTNATAANRSDAYFKFDTTGITNVTGAKLNIYAAVSQNNVHVGVSVCGTGTNWTETGITWSNRPALGTIIGTTNIFGQSSTRYVVDVRSYVLAQKALGNNSISMALHATNATSANVTINPKEAASNRPYLQINTSNRP